MKTILPDACIDEAISWIARLRAHDVSAEEQSRFAEWLASDVRHPVAFDEIVELWQRLGVVAHLPDLTLFRTQSPKYFVIAGRPGHSRR